MNNWLDSLAIGLAVMLVVVVQLRLVCMYFRPQSRPSTADGVYQPDDCLHNSTDNVPLSLRLPYLAGIGAAMLLQWIIMVS